MQILAGRANAARCAQAGAFALCHWPFAIGYRRALLALRRAGFLRLLLPIAMTLPAHAASQRADTLTPKLDALFQDFNQRGSPGASVMIIKDGKIALAKGYGLANVEENIPCGTHTNFRLASVTKQFTAMSVLILADRKQIGRAHV